MARVKVLTHQCTMQDGWCMDRNTFFGPIPKESGLAMHQPSTSIYLPGGLPPSSVPKL